MLEAGECLDPNVSSSTADLAEPTSRVAAAATEVGANLFAALGGASYVYALAWIRRRATSSRRLLSTARPRSPRRPSSSSSSSTPRFKDRGGGQTATGVEAFAHFAFVEPTQVEATEDFRALDTGLAPATQADHGPAVRGKLTFSVASKKSRRAAGSDVVTRTTSGRFVQRGRRRAEAQAAAVREQGARDQRAPVESTVFRRLLCRSALCGEVLDHGLVLVLIRFAALLPAPAFVARTQRAGSR